ncbi:PAS domain S-box protein [Mycobacterium terramassiliense]|nr:PAS domain-containing protein [Mycobacterium terramassiliense]
MSESRRSRRASDSPTVKPRQRPALSVLERIPVPAIALADDGAVLFANAAFAEILGCSRDAVTAMSYEEILHALPTEETLFRVARLRAEAIGELQHLDGSMIFAKMTKSAVIRRAGAVAIATFEQLVERLSRLAEV